MVSFHARLCIAELVVSYFQLDSLYTLQFPSSCYSMIPGSFRCTTTFHFSTPQSTKISCPVQLVVHSYYQLCPVAIAPDGLPSSLILLFKATYSFERDSPVLLEVHDSDQCTPPFLAFASKIRVVHSLFSRRKPQKTALAMITCL